MLRAITNYKIHKYSNVGLPTHFLGMSYYVNFLEGLGKGQIISKANYGSKKRTIKFDFTTMIPQVDLFLLFFGGN